MLKISQYYIYKDISEEKTNMILFLLLKLDTDGAKQKEMYLFKDDYGCGEGNNCKVIRILCELLMEYDEGHELNEDGQNNK